MTASTFDYTSPEVKGSRFWDAIREVAAEGPLVWVDRQGGYWAATSYELVLRIAQDWETFSSARGTSITRPGFDAMPALVPVETDPPRQRVYRRHVNPHLTAGSLADLEARIRAIADELIDPLIGRDQIDVSKEFARVFPGTVFFREVVHCGEEDFRLLEPAARTITFESDDPKKFADAAAIMRGWAHRVLAERAEGADRGEELADIVGAVAHVNDDERLFTDDEHASGLQILASGGIGTSGSALGVIMRVLAEDPELQERVRADPALIPSLIEECLRLEPPLPIEFRTATRDVTLAGQQIRAGDWVAMFFGAANRDPAVFDRPDEVVLERPHHRHVAFGVGVHRCIGSNLARLQMRVAVEQLLARLGPFRIAPGEPVEYLSLQARGPLSVPLELLSQKEPIA